MITLIIVIAVAYITNKLTRLYCVFKYKNDAYFIKQLIKENDLNFDLKRGRVQDAVNESIQGVIEK